MRLSIASLVFFAALPALSPRCSRVAAQAVPSLAAPQVGAVLTRLLDPTYPPSARQAHIIGDVELMLAVRRDGSVESAVVVSGHPMLRQAALDSVQQSQFVCEGCGEAVTRYALKYSFQLTSLGFPKDCDTQNAKQLPAEVGLSRHQVTVPAWAMVICDPAARLLKVRSAKCLYLWRCSTRDEL